ncbi:MAG: hypothetical protein IKL96_10815 [Kiritimatiellae bacterium]|nr:hypothetical protein [Kiritimatiellia bacterium]
MVNVTVYSPLSVPVPLEFRWMPPPPPRKVSQKERRKKARYRRSQRIKRRAK